VHRVVSVRCGNLPPAAASCQDARIPILLVGHVTKEGVIAGPKVIEHMVDTVLQFEAKHTMHIEFCVREKPVRFDQ